MANTDAVVGQMSSDYIWIIYSQLKMRISILGVSLLDIFTAKVVNGKFKISIGADGLEDL